MQSGTLVPAARKVMPMMTSGMPRVKPMMVTYTLMGWEPSITLGFGITLWVIKRKHDLPLAAKRTKTRSKSLVVILNFHLY